MNHLLCQDGESDVSDLPSLDPRKTTVEIAASEKRDSEWRFKDCRLHRDQLMALLPTLEITPEQRTRFTDCGKNAWIMASPSTGRYRVHCNTCKLRWCPRCHQQAANRVKNRLQKLTLKKIPRKWKLITLTSRSSKKPLLEQIKHLRSSFRKLRQRSFWRKRAYGGYAVLETTWNAKTKQWHPHLHIVADTEFMEQRKLSEEWLKCTKNSMIVDIRKIESTRQAFDYLAKYLGKLPSSEIYESTASASEFISAMKGTRVLQHFGTVPKPSEELPDDDNPRDWTPKFRLSTILASAERGDAHAIRILSLLHGDSSHDTELDPFFSQTD